MVSGLPHFRDNSENGAGPVPPIFSPIPPKRRVTEPRYMGRCVVRGDLVRASVWMPGACLSADRTHSSILPIPLLITHRLPYLSPTPPLPLFKQQRMIQTSTPRTPQTHSQKTQFQACAQSRGLRRCMKVLKGRSPAAVLYCLQSSQPQGIFFWVEVSDIIGQQCCDLDAFPYLANEEFYRHLQFGYTIMS